MTSTPARFALGDTVTFTDTVAKSYSDGEVSYPSAGLPKGAGTGIVVGTRTLTDFAVERQYEYGEYGAYEGSYVESMPVEGTARRVWVVSYDMFRKPVLVLDEHAEAAAPIDARAGRQRFAIGQPVQMSGTVEKALDFDNPVGTVTWDRGPLPENNRTRNAPSYAAGIIVGARTLMDHEFRQGSSPSLPLELRPLISGPTMLTFPKKGSARRAWLVSFNLHRKPVLVLDDQAFAEGETPTVVTQTRERVAA